MEHPSTRLLARYALADITDDEELGALEDHLMVCEECRRRALAVDSLGTVPLDGNDKPPLHIAAQSIGDQVALCGDVGHRNVIAEVLVPGMDAAMFCPACLALWRSGGAPQTSRPN